MRELLLGHLPHARRVLLAGCGGGYDILGAVPVVHALRASGVEVALASLSLCYLDGLDGAVQDPEVPNLYAVTGACATERAYCPEAWLARWLDATHGGAHLGDLGVVNAEAVGHQGHVGAATAEAALGAVGRAQVGVGGRHRPGGRLEADPTCAEQQQHRRESRSHRATA